MRALVDWVLPALAGALAGVLITLALTTPDPPALEAAPAPAAELEAAPETEPSALAERTIPADELELLRSTADGLGLDWTILAAVDQLETAGAASTIPAEQRIPGLAYALESAGAPERYAEAIAARGTLPDPDRALELASRLGARAGERVPASKGPLSVPVEGPVLSAFGDRFGVLHDGIDIAAAEGEPIVAPADGVVVGAGPNPIYGEYSCVAHRFDPPLAGAEELTSCFGNQSAIDVAIGDTVEAGQTIGRVGCTGPCLRPHTHFQVRAGSAPSAPTVDPARYLDPAVGTIATGRSLEGGEG
ncbi:M23 family metallopeptidase [Thermoleophilia bacterium SCSIO 60948]|nr:M23 family metallopeptidase [Thermoleophilia bacterium SCSIO 60948]